MRFERAGSRETLDGIGHPRLWIGRGKARFGKQDARVQILGRLRPATALGVVLTAGVRKRRKEEPVWVGPRSVQELPYGLPLDLIVRPCRGAATFDFNLAHSCGVSKSYFGPDSIAGVVHKTPMVDPRIV